MIYKSIEEFDLNIVSKLNVIFQKTDIFLENKPIITCNNLYIQDLDSTSIVSFESNNSLNVEEKTICQCLCNIISKNKKLLGAKSSFIEFFIKFIFQQLGLDYYPIEFRSLALFELRIRDEIMLGIPELSIIKGHSILLIDDENHFKEFNEDIAWGEQQLAGEMIAVAFHRFYNNDNKGIEINKDVCIIYSIRVIGTRFTFYKAIIPYSYLESLKWDYPSESFIIYRYPNIEEGIYNGYNYMIPSERRIIVNILCQLASLFI